MNHLCRKLFRATIVLLLGPLFCQSASAQVRFGYFSYETALRAMPQYEAVQQKLSDLKQQYDAEMQRAEDEFNRKYEEFLDGQREFAPSILQKRQSELQEILTRNLAFKQEAARLLGNAQTELMAPLHQQLADRLRAIGQQRQLAFILNTDNNACPWIDPALGEDISPFLNE